MQEPRVATIRLFSDDFSVISQYVSSNLCDPARAVATLIRFGARLESADAASSKAVTDEIVAEVSRLHKEHRNFARPVEQPVMIGGQTRGGGPAGSAIDQLAVDEPTRPADSRPIQAEV